MDFIYIIGISVFLIIIDVCINHEVLNHYFIFVNITSKI